LVTDGWGPNGDIPGVALPGRPTTVSLDVAYSGADASRLGLLRVQAMVVDAYGVGAAVELGSVPVADGARHTLAAKLDPHGGAIAYPLRITSVSVYYVAPNCPMVFPPGPDSDPRC
jgi:hypothetical protein